ncbi:MAG TPA: GTPase Era [Corynebacteriales bacterium]|nr:GTPase Era [Mycobacteriales bacterium]
MRKQRTKTMTTNEEYRSGFVCFVGRPNTGKSTLMNALVGQKIAITSERPQTTRHTIRGIISRDDAQIIIVDTPGIHRPRTLLGQRLNDLVQDTYAGVDLIGLCVPADQPVGPGDRYILDEVRKIAPETPVMGIVTKIDKVPSDQLIPQLVKLADLLGEDAPLVPVSAQSGEQLELLTDVIVEQLPTGPKFYPDEEITDDDTEKFLAELVREAILEEVRDELPHSVACVIEEIYPDPEDDERTVVHAVIYVERESQKGIVIGKKGARLRKVGQRARQGMQRVLGTRVYLDIFVKVMKDWQTDPKMLEKLGF